MRARKKLGQHFLKSRVVVQVIVRAADLKKSDAVLEIGPGKGVLTKALLEKAGKVIAIEKDGRLVAFLKEKFAAEIKNKKLILVHDDILSFDPSSYKLKAISYKLVANIPYYITGELLKKFLSSDIQPSKMVLLVQKEVARRIAKEKKESILSLSVKAYGTPKYIKSVPARHFNPKPKVDSAILVIDNISKCFFQKPQTRFATRSDLSETRREAAARRVNADGNADPLRHPLRLVGDEARSCSEASQRGLDEKEFFGLVRTGFSHKRKLLLKNIEHLFSTQSMQTVFEQCDIPQKARAEDLSLAEWKCLSQRL